MGVHLQYIIFLSVCLCGTLLEATAEDLTSISIVAPSKRALARQKPFKRSPGYPLQRPRILNKKSPLNVLQNGPYFINHYIYCDTVDHQTLDQIKTGSNIQLYEKDKFYTITSPLESLTSGFEGSKSGGYQGDKEIHILHLPKGESHDLDDVKLHLALENAYKTPEIDLDLNRNLENFEVNLASIRPPDVDASFIPTPTASFVDVVKPLIHDHISKQPTKYFGRLPSLFFKGGSSGVGTGESLDIPHIENHPLERDYGKTSYDTPGAVNSYGQPIGKGPNPKPTSSLPSSGTHDGGYNSAGSVDSYGNPVTDQALAHLSTKVAQDFYHQQNYVNQLNEIHDLSDRRRRQGTIKGSPNSEEIRYPNHKYD